MKTTILLLAVCLCLSNSAYAEDYRGRGTVRYSAGNWAAPRQSAPKPQRYANNVDRQQAEDAREKAQERRGDRYKQQIEYTDKAFNDGEPVVVYRKRRGYYPSQCWDEYRKRYVDCTTLRKQRYKQSKDYRNDCWDFSAERSDHCKDLTRLPK